MPNSNFYSNGKLLLTGEYLVLDGALALALPTKYGQSLVINPNTTDFIDWKSYDENHAVWFEASFLAEEIDKPNQFRQNQTSKTLIDILHVAKQLNPDFKLSNISVETHLTFPRHWGLGTSSTLINNIANWAQVNPYELLAQTFGGSGYDIACAQINKPLIYQLKANNNEILNQVQDNKTIYTSEVDFNPEFKDALYFVYLNKKQNSRDAIEAYRKNTSDLTKDIVSINTITEHIIACKTFSDFENLINRHEQIMSSILNQQPIKKSLFSDFHGSIKSLGAWGGDFVLATSKENPSEYFKNKGFDTVIPYSKIIL